MPFRPDAAVLALGQRMINGGETEMAKLWQAALRHIIEQDEKEVRDASHQ